MEPAIDFGVCRMSIVPVRAQPRHQAEMVTQLLFGEHYRVLQTSENNRWVRVETGMDQYPGWIDIRQHHTISEDYYAQIDQSDFLICTDPVSSAVVGGNPLQLVLGSVLPLAANELFKSQAVTNFKGLSKPLHQKLAFQELQLIAFHYLYGPYQWGGRTPFGIDCSGLVQQVFRIGGYKLPRDSYQQAHKGRPVAGLGGTEPGDLAFFATGSDKINHVGIILEGSRIIHASGRVRIDQLTEEGIYDGRQLTHNNIKAITRVLL